MNYWVELINSELKNNSKITEEIVFSKFINKYFTLSRKFIGKVNSKLKIINYYLRKLSEKIKNQV